MNLFKKYQWNSEKLKKADRKVTIAYWVFVLLVVCGFVIIKQIVPIDDENETLAKYITFGMLISIIGLFSSLAYSVATQNADKKLKTK